MQGKRLYRSRSDRMIAGVAGGLAAVFNIDPLFVRLGFLALGFINGVGIVLYLIMWLLVPNEGSVAVEARDQVRESVGEMQEAAESLVQRGRNMFNS